MPYLVGTDEAGYGPNLGPLVVTATVWRIDSECDRDLYSALSGAVRRASDQSDDDRPDEVVIGDSKELYKPGKGLAGLEQGVFTCLAAVKKKPRTWKKIWRDVASSDTQSLNELPWYRDFDDRLPLDLTSREVKNRAERFVDLCEQAGCEPKRIQSRVVCPARFNELVDEYGNKASALSHTTLQLVRDVLKKVPSDETTYVLCDKHGGRNKYGPLLNDTFPDTLAMVRQEGREESVYQLGNGRSRREIAFRAKADDAFLPAALASMVSKYLRELAMRAFNDFWTSKIADLKPTAGYPGDARRFKDQIASTQKKLGIDDRVLWRCR